jgi:hypothetical protein
MTRAKRMFSGRLIVGRREVRLHTTPEEIMAGVDFTDLRLTDRSWDRGEFVGGWYPKEDCAIYGNVAVRYDRWSGLPEDQWPMVYFKCEFAPYPCDGPHSRLGEWIETLRSIAFPKD